MGFRVEQFNKNNIAFTVFDMSGASVHRDLWSAYYSECGAIVFVIDCQDKLRICVAKKELDDMLAHPGPSLHTPHAAHRGRQSPACAARCEPLGVRGASLSALFHCSRRDLGPTRDRRAVKTALSPVTAEARL